MKIAIKQLKQLIKEQVEEARGQQTFGEQSLNWQALRKELGWTDYDAVAFMTDFIHEQGKWEEFVRYLKPHIELKRKIMESKR